jgi:hypothetical protein
MVGMSKIRLNGKAQASIYLPVQNQIRSLPIMRRVWPQTAVKNLYPSRVGGCSQLRLRWAKTKNQVGLVLTCSQLDKSDTP